MNTTPASHRVLSDLRAEIEGGGWPVGTRLPSERALTERFASSRVIIREALAALKSLGMIETRPGSGAYVTAVAPARGGLDIAARTHGEILDCLELRRAVEVEATRLAAQRATPSQLQNIVAALEEMDAAVSSGQSGAEADWAFHLAIAAATGNAYFTRTMDAFGPRAIPRRRRASHGVGTASDAEERQLVEEHRAIVAALTDQDAAAAAQAMHDHLTKALRRYRHAGPGGG